jgi:DNA-binding transcriptional LysR family regulator
MARFVPGAAGCAKRFMPERCMTRPSNRSVVAAPEEAADALASSFAASYAGVVAFIAVATEGSFAKAGDRLGIGRSAVSRNVKKLEAQLGVRLFLRTTRSNSLTREGELFYRNCHPGVERIVQALDDMRELREGPPRGPLRVCSTVGFGRKVVAPLLHGFQDAFPEITLDLLLDERPCDFAAGRVDVAFREGRLEDSQIVARQIVPMQKVVCASPAYARAHGLPHSVGELADHRCIDFRLVSGRTQGWEFKVSGHAQRFQPTSAIAYNDADLVLQAVLDGRGLAQLGAYQACDLVRSGSLVTCLGQYAPDDGGHYACYLSREQLPSRIRVFIDYMTTHIRALDLHCPATYASAFGSVPTESRRADEFPCARLQ